jgi:hypothetical protein
MVASGLISIFDKGYSNFHIVGFSLGAQIAGMIGRKVKQMSKNKHQIARITGLDPGQIPAFINTSIQFLNPSDAEFLDIIHTETKYLGSATTNGHSMFWVNGGRTQPMCRNNIELSELKCGINIKN